MRESIIFKKVYIPDHLQKAYDSDLESEKFFMTRFFCHLSLCLTVTSAFVDFWALPSTIFETNIIRGLLIILVVSILWAIHQPNLRRYCSQFQYLLYFGPALTVVSMLYVSSPEDTGHYIYSSFLILLIILFFSWSTLSLRALIVSTFLIVLCYTLSLSVDVMLGADLNKSIATYIPTVFIMLSAAGAGYVGKNINENNLRENFLSRQSLKESLKTQHYFANHDELTGLSNRRDAERFFDEDLLYAKEHKATHFVMLLDLNRFKVINDEHGHSAGDEVLKVTAKRLRNCLRESDSISRIGGDEFAISIVLDKNDKDYINDISDKIQQRVIQPIRLGDIDVSVGISAGVASYPDDADDCMELLKIADTRMYEAKRKQDAEYNMHKSSHDTQNGNVSDTPLESLPV